MIRFLGPTKDGKVRVAVVDYSREKHGENEFSFREIEPGESLTQYFDRLMNQYWWNTGKNKRRYQDL